MQLKVINYYQTNINNKHWLTFVLTFSPLEKYKLKIYIVQ